VPPACVIVMLRSAIITEADRLVDGFGATANATVPFPLPPLPTVSQVALLTGVQAQSVGALMLMLPFPPAAVNAVVLDEIETLQAVEGACVTVRV
jgi:hypothetical protein